MPLSCSIRALAAGAPRAPFRPQGHRETMAAGIPRVRKRGAAESVPIPVTPLTPRSGGLRLRANWPLRFLSN